MQTRFEWDERKAEENVRKHGIFFEVAQYVFADRLCFSQLDNFASEQRWQTIGEVGGFPLLLVVHTIRYDEEQEIIRIISARPAEPKEARLYAREVRQI